MFEHDAYEEARAIFNKLYRSGGLEHPGVKKIYQNNVQYWRLRLPKNEDKERLNGTNKKDSGTTDAKEKGSRNINRKKYYGHPISLDKAAEEFSFMPADPFSVEDHVIRKELYQALYAAINGLEDELRSITILCYFEGMSEDKAAEVLGFTKSQVHCRKDKIIKKLRETLKDFS